MADSDADGEDKQLAPSERRLAKARSEGQMPRSRDVGHALVLGAAVAGLAIFGGDLGARLLALVRDGLRLSRAQVFESSRMLESLSTGLQAALWLVVPAALLLVAASVMAAMIPGGATLTATPLMPKLSRLSPLAGLKRIFSRDSVVDLAKLAALALALVLVAFWFVLDRIARYSDFSAMPLTAALDAVHSESVAGLALLAALLALSAAVDAPLQWWRHRRRLKMTHREAREEVRESEGDPMLRNRLRSRQREIARGRMLAAVPAADVIITNPTHYAVAVSYDQSRSGAPRVVAKGADHLAARIREVAMDAGVPLFEAPALARALHAQVRIDSEIPAALYNAVAQVLAYVYRLKSFVPGREAHPLAPQDLEIPPGFDPAGSAQ